MKSRSFTVAVAAMAALLAVVPGRAQNASRLNVLFIPVDDLNHWVGYFGRNAQVKTPNIDRLAARGVRFTRAYAAAPICNPSRTAVLSGMRPSTTGVYDQETDWRTSIPADKTLPTQFRNAGYFVGGAGKVYHFNRPTDWEVYMRPRAMGEQQTGERGERVDPLFNIKPFDGRDEDLPDHEITSWIAEQLGKKHDRPFFLACGLLKPHLPWKVPRRFYEMYPPDKIPMPPYQEKDLEDIPPAGVAVANPKGDHAKILELGRWKETMQAYAAAVSYADMNVGRVIEALDRSPYRDNTIIVLWGDHGWHLGEKHHWRKQTLWEEGVRAPLIWIAPGVTKAGGVCERTVDFLTLYPTLLDLCGIPIPKHVEGKSIRSLLVNPKAAWDLPAVSTYLFGNHAVRTEGWRYIRYNDGGEELYDETKDPYEWTNRAAEPGLASIKAQLARWLPKINNHAPEGSHIPGLPPDR